ncbi:MAG: TorF family putative porin, partial [Chromatiales bacterium]
MRIKTTATAASIALLGLSSTAFAEVSMNLGVTSNYVWRGVTQTDDKPAISGGVDWSGDSGLYAGAWASNVDFGSCCETTYELDLYGGYKGEISDFGYDAGLIYYTYDPDDDA